MRKLFKKYPPQYIFLSALLALAFVIWSAVFRNERDNLLVAFLYVGQGDAIFVETPVGRHLFFR